MFPQFKSVFYLIGFCDYLFPLVVLTPTQTAARPVLFPLKVIKAVTNLFSVVDIGSKSLPPQLVQQVCALLKFRFTASLKKTILVTLSEAKDS